MGDQVRSKRLGGREAQTISMNHNTQRLVALEHDFVSLLAEVLHIGEHISFDAQEPLQLLCDQLEIILRIGPLSHSSHTAFPDIDGIIPLTVNSRDNQLMVQGAVWMSPSECTPLLLSAQLSEHQAKAHVSVQLGVSHLRLCDAQQSTKTIQKFFLNQWNEHTSWMNHLEWTTHPEKHEAIRPLQYRRTIEKQRRALITRIEKAMEQGETPAQLIHTLTTSGLGVIQMISALRTMTGASIRDVKLLGQWWNPEQGITDASKFNHHVYKLFETSKKNS